MAIVLPLLVTLVMGIIYFGIAYNAKVELTGAVREGARALALGKSVDEAKAAVTDGTSLPADKVEFNDGETQTCGDGAESAVIVATYDWTYTIPFVG